MQTNSLMTQHSQAEPAEQDPTASGLAAGMARSEQGQRVRLTDVARAAGVSAMTVSRVVNGAGSVRAATRDCVQRIIRQLGYSPDFRARSLALARPERIAVVHDDSRSACLSRLLIGVLEQSRSMGAQVLARSIEPDDPSAWRTVSRLVQDRLAGVILAPPLGDSPCLLDALRAAGVPVVVICCKPAAADTLRVGIDERRAAYEMTQQLLALGHRRIGFIGGPPSWSAGEERWQGFLAALKNTGIDTGQARIARGDCSFRSGLAAAMQILDVQEPPTAIFAGCDNMAAAAIAAAHTRKLQVPRDLTIVGFDDDLAACAVWPELTTVSQPVREIAAEAVKLVLAASRSGGEPLEADRREKLLPHQLILRDSAAPLPAGM
jgi:LacI family transcriptional regulator